VFDFIDLVNRWLKKPLKHLIVQILLFKVAGKQACSGILYQTFPLLNICLRCSIR